MDRESLKERSTTMEDDLTEGRKKRLICYFPREQVLYSNE